MSISFPKQAIKWIAFLKTSKVAISLLMFVLGLIAGTALPAWKQDLQTDDGIGDFSSSPVANILCKHDESANAMLEQGNFVQSDWTGLSSVGGQTRVWMRQASAQYLIVRTDQQGMTCFLDTGQF